VSLYALERRRFV